MNRSAVFDETRTYRYLLTRSWIDGSGKAVFVLLNPSKADEVRDDNTVSRCIRFAQRWGYHVAEIVNIFALRSTDPKALYQAADPVGPDNDHWIKTACKGAAIIVAAWGVHGAYMDRGKAVGKVLAEAPHVRCFGVTAGGFPRHPLYIKNDAALVELPK